LVQGVAHVTHDLDTTFKVKRSKVKVTSCGVLGGAMRFGAHSGRRGAGAYRGGRPPTTCFCCFRLCHFAVTSCCIETKVFTARRRYA